MRRYVVLLSTVVCVASASFALADDGSPVVPAGPVDHVTEASAVPSEATSAPDAPLVRDAGDEFVSVRSTVRSTVPEDPQAPLSVSTASGALTLQPLGVDEKAADGAATADRSAVVFSGTDDVGTTTTVVPQPEGLETFTTIREAAAREDFSWRVGLRGDQVLRPRADGSVDIVDPTPEIPALMAPAREGVDPADVQVEGAGTAGYRPPRAATPGDLEGAVVALGDPADDEALVPRADGTAPADAPAEDSPAARAAATAQLGATLGRLDDEASEQARAVAEQAAAAAPVKPSELVVASIKPAWAKDAEGKAVPASLEVDGDVVTMHVDHRAAGVAYPVTADPMVWVRDMGTGWHYSPAYLAYSGAFYGSWSIANLQSSFWGYDAYGNGLWAVNFWGTWGLVYNVAWSPLLMQVAAGTPGAIVASYQWWGYGPLDSWHQEWRFDPAIDCLPTDDGLISECGDDTQAESPADATVDLEPVATAADVPTSAGTGQKYKVRVRSGTYATIRSYAKSFAIGNMRDGWTVVANTYNEATKFVGGYIGGNWGDCGWVLINALSKPKGKAGTNCPVDVRYPLSRFAVGVNCGKGQCDDGYATKLVATTPLCANIFPWKDPSQHACNDQLGSVTQKQVDSGYTVYWRWVSKGTGSRKYVLVRDPHRSHGDAPWLFVHRSALKAKLCGKDSCRPTGNQ